jgi:hypothetical protein
LIRHKPDIEIDYSDEGDWSLAIQSGSHAFAIHPTGSTYRTFTVFRHTADDIEILKEGVSLSAPPSSTRSPG